MHTGRCCRGDFPLQCAVCHLLAHKPTAIFCLCPADEKQAAALLDAIASLVSSDSSGTTGQRTLLQASHAAPAPDGSQAPMSELLTLQEDDLNSPVPFYAALLQPALAWLLPPARGAGPQVAEEHRYLLELLTQELAPLVEQAGGARGEGAGRSRVPRCLVGTWSVLQLLHAAAAARHLTAPDCALVSAPA